MKIATEGVFNFLVLTPVQMEFRGKFFVATGTAERVGLG